MENEETLTIPMSTAICAARHIVAHMKANAPKNLPGLMESVSMDTIWQTALLPV